MFGFHFLVWFLCVRGVHDTQCGFKLFSRPAARLLFYNQHVERWFVAIHYVDDLEIIYHSVVITISNLFAILFYKLG